jgi:hypothetical protein
MTTQDTVYSPLIVLSFTEEGIKNAIGGGNFKSIVGGADVMTFPNSHSNNFTKLVHSFGTEKEGGYSIQLEMIDPVAEFEAKFMSFDLATIFANDLFSEKGVIESEVTQRLIDVEKENLGSTGPVQALKEAATTQKVWITYGLGNDLSKWAGPFELKLINAQLKIDTKNVKKLILKFFPHGDPVTSPPPITGENRDQGLEGVRNAAIGRVGPFEIGKGPPVGSKEFGGGGFVGNWSKFAKDSGLETNDLNTFFQNFDVHATLMTCLRTMVRKATNCNNVVALFPNINTYGIKAIAHGVMAKRGTALKVDDNKTEWLVDAADKVFSMFGASMFIDSIGDLVSSDPKSNEPLETNYTKYLEYFESCEDTRKKYWDKAKFYVEMKSVTELLEGHRKGIKDKVKFIKEALMQTYPTLQTTFISESRSDVIKNFKGSPGVVGDGTIIFFGDKSLIQNVVFGNGEASARFLHPTDKKLIGKGTSTKAEALPEFRMNVKDPNIISIEVNTDKTYMAALMAGFESNARSKVARIGATLSDANKTGGQADSGKDNVVDAMIATGTVTQQQQMDMLLAAESALTNTEAKATYEMNSDYNNNTLGVLAAGYEQLYKMAVNVTITTLPMFHLSDASVISKECVIIASAPEAVIPGKTGSSPNIANSFFSGAYKILGFQHEITSTGIAKSQFVLAKIVPASAGSE